MKKDKEDESKHEQLFDDKQASILPSWVEKHAPLKQKLSSEQMKNQKRVVAYREKKMELQFTYSSSYLQTRMILKDCLASAFLIAADVKFLGSVFCMFATLSKLSLLLPEVQVLEVPAMAREKSRQGIWRTYFAGNRAKMVHCRCAVVDGLANELKSRQRCRACWSTQRHFRWNTCRPYLITRRVTFLQRKYWRINKAGAPGIRS